MIILLPLLTIPYHRTLLHPIPFFLKMRIKTTLIQDLRTTTAGFIFLISFHLQFSKYKRFTLFGIKSHGNIWSPRT